MDNNEILIIDYGLGNIGSAVNMIKRAGGHVTVTSDRDKILKSKKILLPGVGSFDSGMQNLNESGLTDVIKEFIFNKENYLFGICLGMQLLFDRSEEGICNGLGLIKGDVVKFDVTDRNMKVPHMGWNSIEVKRNSPLLNSMSNSRFYFVHSYFVKCLHQTDVLATTEYGLEFSSVVNHNNVFGAQFHPEKSHKYGLQLLSNFIQL
jgi:glutamine amidotransferase